MKNTKKSTMKLMIEDHGGIYQDNFVCERGSTVTLEALIYLEKCIADKSPVKTIEQAISRLGDKLHSCTLHPDGSVEFFIKKT